MASFHELNLRSRLLMKVYRYQRYDTAPHAPLRLPLSECRVALITTAGLHLTEQPPFNATISGGDCSYREIPNTVATQSIAISHQSRAYDTRDTKRDANLVFPLDRFRELTRDGTLGSLNHRHFSFMGSILKPQRLIEKTAPEVAQLLKSDRVDAAFLTPV